MDEKHPESRVKEGFRILTSVRTILVVTRIILFSIHGYLVVKFCHSLAEYFCHRDHRDICVLCGKKNICAIIHHIVKEYNEKA
jgi:hypothetical protein